MNSTTICGLSCLLDATAAEEGSWLPGKFRPAKKVPAHQESSCLSGKFLSTRKVPACQESSCLPGKFLPVRKVLVHQESSCLSGKFLPIEKVPAYPDQESSCLPGTVFISLLLRNSITAEGTLAYQSSLLHIKSSIKIHLTSTILDTHTYMKENWHTYKLRPVQAVIG